MMKADNTVSLWPPQKMLIYDDGDDNDYDDNVFADEKSFLQYPGRDGRT